MDRLNRRTFLLGSLGSAALVAAGCGGGREGEEATGGGEGAAGYPDPGINDQEIVLGGSLPFSGPASVFGTISRATEAYFAFVNEEQGGVTMGDGVTRRLRWIAYDDAYSPPRTVENVRRLIERDQVFALHLVLGTPTNSAIWDYVEQQQVPNMFVLTGATKWGADLDEHRMTIGGLMAYSTESLFYVDWLEQNMPDARPAILYQNDDFGKDYYNTLKPRLEEIGTPFIAEQTYETTDPDVSSQVANLAASGADVFFNIATGKFPVQSLAAKGRLGWDALTMMHSPLANIETVFRPAGIEASTGAMAVKYLKEPGDPAWADDPAMVEYEEKVVQYGQNIEVLDFNNTSAWAFGEALVKVLEQTPEPTRASLIETVRNLDGLEIGLLFPGITMNSGPDDGFLIESGQLVRFTGTEFEELGDVVSFEGETPTEDVPGVD